jgi:hypothetical protein
LSSDGIPRFALGEESGMTLTIADCQFPIFDWTTELVLGGFQTIGNWQSKIDNA